MAVAAFAAAAAVGYVLTRAAWIFVGWPGVGAVVLLLAAALYAAWRRRPRWAVVGGFAAGSVVGALALTL